MAKSTASRRANGDGWVYKDGSQWRYKLAVGTDAATGKIQYKGGPGEDPCRSHGQASKATGRVPDGPSCRFFEGLTEQVSRRLGREFDQAKPRDVDLSAVSMAHRPAIVPHLGKKRVEDVRRPDVQKLIALKATQLVQPRTDRTQGSSGVKLSRNTLRLIRAVLHAAFNDAIRDGLASFNPASHVELPREAKKAPVSLKEAEVRTLLEIAANADMAEFWLFLFLTGCRLAEASGLRWQDVDLTKRTARIQGQLQRVERTLQYQPGTKTNQTRDLQLPDVLVSKLQELKSRQLVEGISDPDGVVFLNPYGRRLDPKYVRDRLAELCRTAGVPVVSPHKIRHTAATLALGATGDLHAVQKMLGHSQISLTANLYGHGTAEAQRRLANTLSDIIVPKGGQGGVSD